ncbi:MAG: tRNA (adenosine(37)-N6)-dimethylallyltransferase [Paracoccaceae bacterium]
MGGTGLYFTALTNGLSDIPDIREDIHLKAEDYISSGCYQTLLDDIVQQDPETAARIDMLNPRRVQRAWEVLESTGRGLAAWQDATPAPLLALENTTALLVDAPKDELSPRIEKRFRRMVENGALEECRAVLKDWDESLPSSRAIGAHELIAFLREEMNLETAITAATIATRQYAKRQRTWFRARMTQWKQIRIPA